MSQLIKFAVFSVPKLLSTSNGNRIKTSTIGIWPDEWHAFLSFEDTVALSHFTLLRSQCNLRGGNLTRVYGTEKGFFALFSG